LPTLAALAAALGTDRGTLSRWRAAGAPSGPPYCELAWRTWAAEHGRNVNRAPRPALLAALAEAGVAEYRRVADPNETGEDEEATSLGWKARKLRAEALSAELRHQREAREVIPMEAVRRLVAGLSTIAAELAGDVPGLLDGCQIGAEELARVRAHLEDRIRERRAKTAESMGARFAAFLRADPPPRPLEAAP
jgi:hypothetical protein